MSDSSLSHWGKEYKHSLLRQQRAIHHNRVVGKEELLAQQRAGLVRHAPEQLIVTHMAARSPDPFWNCVPPPSADSLPYSAAVPSPHHGVSAAAVWHGIPARRVAAHFVASLPNGNGASTRADNASKYNRPSPAAGAANSIGWAAADSYCADPPYSHPLSLI